MTFLAPWLLLGLLATAIPPLLHLRRSRRQRRITFSHTAFFDENFLRAARRARLQDRLLMALRMLLLAALALALAQPMWGGATLLPATGPRHVVLVLDDSASMAVGDGMARARAAAAAVLDGLRADRGDRAALILAGRRAALAAAPSEARRQVYVIGDLPDAALPPDPLPATTAATETIFVSTAPPPGGNLAVSAVQTHAARPMLGVPFSFRALVSNHGDRPRTAEVSLIIDGRPVAQRRLDVPPRRDQFVRLVHAFDAAGWRRGHVQVAAADGHADALPLDDRRHFVVHVADRLHVAAATSSPSQLAAQDELFFARAALTVGSGGDAGITVADLPLAQLAAVNQRDPRPGLLLLANVARLDDAQAAAVEQFAAAGGGVLVTMGDRVDAQSWNRLAAAGRAHGGLLPATLTPLPQEVAALATDEAVTYADAAHPALAGLADEPGLRTARFRPLLAATPTPDAAVLLTTGDARPLLIEKPFGLGRIALLNTTIDRDATDLPVQPIFVPLLHRLAAHLALGAGDTPRFTLTGDGIDLPTAASDTGWALLGPGGEPVPALTDDAGIRYWPTLLAGVYELRRGGATEPEALLACNLDHHESDATPLDEPGLAERIGGGHSWAYAAADQPQAAVLRAGLAGVALWDALLWAALAVAALEPLVSRFLARGRGEVVAGGVA